MIVITPRILSEYTCQVCHKHFLDKDYLIITKDTPVCSTRCVFMIYYKIIKVQGKKELLCIAKELNVINYSKLSDTNLVYEVTKKYPKPTIATINVKGQRDRDKNEGTRTDTKGQRDNNSTPMYIGGCPLSLSLRLPISNNVPCPFVGGLN